MAWIPGGQFEMGARTAFPEEAPPTKAALDGFWMDVHEVTNGQFAKFVSETGYLTTAERGRDIANLPSPTKEKRAIGSFRFVPPTDTQQTFVPESWWQFDPHATWRTPAGANSSVKDIQSHPVVHVTYEDALAYAKWLGRDLPTEAQWEYAANSGAGTAKAGPQGTTGKHMANVWRGIFPTLNSADDGFASAAPVGCFPPNRHGLYDMIGNVWELTQTLYTPFHGAPPQDATHVIKGGSFLCSADYCARFRPAARQPRESDISSDHVGFRTVLNTQDPRF